MTGETIGPDTPREGWAAGTFGPQPREVIERVLKELVASDLTFAEDARCIVYALEDAGFHIVLGDAAAPPEKYEPAVVPISPEAKREYLDWLTNEAERLRGDAALKPKWHGSSLAWVEPPQPSPEKPT